MTALQGAMTSILRGGKGCLNADKIQEAVWIHYHGSGQNADKGGRVSKIPKIM